MKKELEALKMRVSREEKDRNNEELAVEKAKLQEEYEKMASVQKDELIKNLQTEFDIQKDLCREEWRKDAMKEFASRVLYFYYLLLGLCHNCRPPIVVSSH